MEFRSGNREGPFLTEVPENWLGEEDGLETDSLIGHCFSVYLCTLC